MVVEGSLLQYVCWEIVAVNVLLSFGGLLFTDCMSYYGKCFVKYSGCLLGGCLPGDCCWRMFAGLGIVIFWGSATQECFGVCNRCSLEDVSSLRGYLSGDTKDVYTLSADVL